MHTCSTSAHTRPKPPLLRWAGSKRQLLPELERYWRAGSFEEYVEPFAGSAILFFRLTPKKAILGDLNQELVETYETLKESFRSVYGRLKELPVNAETYYRLRRLRAARLTPIDRAVRFVYLNRFCFNGIFRTNRRGDFNVPYSGRKTGALPPFEVFEATAAMLRTARLIPGDFGKVLSRTKKGQFVYLDPPYCKSSRRYRGEYGPKAFGTRDLARLKSHLLEMDKRGVRFVVSYEDSKNGRSLGCPTWITRRVLVRRHVAGFVSSRRRASELLISNIVLDKG